MNSKEKKAVKAAAERHYDYPHSIDVFKHGADFMNKRMNKQVKLFIHNLIDANIIDCASHDDIMQRWTDFQNI